MPGGTQATRPTEPSGGERPTAPTQGSDQSTKPKEDYDHDHGTVPTAKDEHDHNHDFSGNVIPVTDSETWIKNALVFIGIVGVLIGTALLILKRKH